MWHLSSKLVVALKKKEDAMRSGDDLIMIEFTIKRRKFNLPSSKAIPPAPVKVLPISALPPSSHFFPMLGEGAIPDLIKWMWHLLADEDRILLW